MLHLLQKGTSEMRLSLFGIELPFHFSLLELSFLLHLGFSWGPQSTNSVSFFPAYSSTHSSTVHNNHPSANAALPLHPSLQTFYPLSFFFQPPPLPALLPHPPAFSSFDSLWIFQWNAGANTRCVKLLYFISPYSCQFYLYPGMQLLPFFIFPEPVSLSCLMIRTLAAV